MAKNIIFCADGTWNNPNEDENADHCPDPTNVYKLFTCLEGALSLDSLLNADEQEKTLLDNGTPQQVSKYIHGVGDSRNPINKLLGGAFGAGVIARVVRGYNFHFTKLRAGREYFYCRLQPGSVYGARLGRPDCVTRSIGS